MEGSLGIFETLYKLFILAIIFFLAFIVTRFIAARYMNTFRGRNITVIEQVSLGIDRVLYIVKVGKQYFLLSASGKNINYLSQIDPSNITVSVDNSEMYNQKMFDAGSFAKYLDSFRKKLSKNETVSIKQENFSNSRKANTNQEINDTENIEKNVSKIRDIFSSIKVPNKDGVE